MNGRNQMTVNRVFSQNTRFYTPRGHRLRLRTGVETARRPLGLLVVGRALLTPVDPMENGAIYYRSQADVGAK